MTLVPLRARALSNGIAVVTNDTGRFFAASGRFLGSLSQDKPSPSDAEFLRQEGHWVDETDSLLRTSHIYDVAQRFACAGSLNYLILVPTLRCNLACTYCQVSRVGLDQSGFDWSQGTLEAVLRLIDGLDGPSVKIEFQGGEPTLRPDLLKAVIEKCEGRTESEFVICTNLSDITDDTLALFDRDNVFISTSLDGDRTTHATNRTKTPKETDRFRRNLEFVIERYGPKKVSALPTIDPTDPPEADSLIEAYSNLGLTSIYLRPINYHGFARKRHAHSREQDATWRCYYEQFVWKLIERNWECRDVVLEETYLKLCLNRIFRPGVDHHVDLRNPNPVGVDYVVIDYDGNVYPTDESRMLSRSGIIDLCIGDLNTGWDTEKRRELNRHSSNAFDEHCARCAYQPYCGRDIVDDLSRYGRIDLPRTETAFCRKHLHIFDFLFELIYSEDERATYSLCRWLGLTAETTTLGAYRP